MPHWHTTLNLLPEWEQAVNGSLSTAGMAGVIAQKLNDLQWPEDFASDKELLVEEFSELAKDPDTADDDFNFMMNELYDIADLWIGDDTKLCWVKTF